MDVKIPDKLTFRRSEVIKITKLDGKVLDYWEKEFECFVPLINKMEEKFYSRKDIQLILKIKQLMLVQKIPKSQIKVSIKQESDSQESIFQIKRVKNKIDPDKLNKIKRNLKDILTILNKNGK